MSSRLWQEVRDKGFEGMDEEVSGVSSSSEADDEKDDSAVESDSESVDDRVARINDMADDMEETIRKHKAYQMTIDRKIQKREIKSKLLID